MTLALLLAFLLIAQDRPAEKCALSGTVVDSTTGVPLNKVQILLEPLGDSEGPMAVANTGAKGNFSMVELDPGQYRIKAVRNGYLDTYYGARRGDSKGITVILEAGQQLEDLQVKLLPYAVIAGTIRDPEGEPVAGAAVVVRRLIYRDGQRAFDDSETIISDDLGQYRAANLTPGKYYVEARPKDLFDSFHPPVDHSPKGSQPVEALFAAIYPGVQDRASARAVQVAAGERVISIDITLPRGRIYRVSGHATSPAGVTANIILDPPDSPFGDRIAWAYNVKGDFEIRGIPSGSYLLTAWAETPANPSHAERRHSSEMALSGGRTSCSWWRKGTIACDEICKAKRIASGNSMFVEGALDRRQELSFVNEFRQDVTCSAFHCLDGRIDIAAPGNEDDREGRRNKPPDLESIHTGHLEI